MKNKEYTKKVEKLLEEILGKYYDITRPIDESLTSLIGDWSKDMLLRAIRNVVFEKNVASVKGHEIKFWTLRPYPEFLQVIEADPNANPISWLADKVVEEQLKLRKIVYAKNNWRYQDAKPVKFEYLRDLPGGLKEFWTFEEFKTQYEAYVKSEELLRAIYVMAYEAYYKGYHEGFHFGVGEGARTQRNEQAAIAVKVAHSLTKVEWELDELKKQISLL